MSHKHGAYLGGVRDLESLRMRCLCPAGSDCWILRTARGRPMPRGTMKIWSTAHGASISARKLSVIFSGRRVDSDLCVVDTCGTHDCVNPAHLLPVTRKRMLRDCTASGVYKTARKTIANRLSAAKRSRVTPQMRAEIAASPLTAAALGELYGISPSWVSVLRNRAARSVFSEIGAGA